ESCPATPSSSVIPHRPAPDFYTLSLHDALPISTAAPLPYLRAASDLEQTGRLQSASRAYQSAMQKWPDQPTARFGLANTQWAMNQRDAAIRQFQQLVNEFPDFQAGWNNLATGLEILGCDSEAAKARSCADGSVDKAQHCRDLRCPAASR